MTTAMNDAETRQLKSDLSFAREQRDASRARVAQLETEKAALEKEWSERLERYRNVLTESLQKAVNERDRLRDELSRVNLERNKHGAS